jgi:hypothetical protein
MTPRLFSILRRKPGLIDLITPIQPPTSGVVGYRLKTDTAVNGSFSTTILESTLYGFTDPSVAGPQNVIQPGEHVRIIFRPQDHSLTDGAFWLKLVYVDSGNAEMTSPAPSAVTLVLPPFVGNEQSGFNGTAPSGATIANSLRIDLPRQMSNFRIRNLSTTILLYVAFQEEGPEIIVPGQSVSQESVGFDGLVSSIWVRGASGTAAFSVQCTYANPR